MTPVTHDHTVPVFLAAVLFAFVLGASERAQAVPKLDIKASIHIGTRTYVSRTSTFQLSDGSVIRGRQPDTSLGWGGGVSARVRHGKIFGEIGLIFSRVGFRIDEEVAMLAAELGDPIPQEFVGRSAQMNSLEIPMLFGAVPYKNPFFKLFFYAGLVNTFNIRGVIRLGSGRQDRVRFSPKDLAGVPLAIYQASARFGVQTDLAMFNFDFSYSIGLNSATATDFRTNTHSFRLALGYLF